MTTTDGTGARFLVDLGPSRRVGAWSPPGLAGRTARGRTAAIVDAQGDGTAGISWGRLWLVLTGRLYLAFVAGLLLWAVLPLVFGWHAFVILSGSMEPRLLPGDVVAAQPVTDPSTLVRGNVIVADNPARPGTRISHRIVARSADDRGFITRGDANPANDSTPVPDTAVRGIGRLRIPFVGLPFQWAATGAWFLLAGWAVITVGLLVLVDQDRRRARRRTDGGPPGPGSRVHGPLSSTLVAGGSVDLRPGRDPIAHGVGGNAAARRGAIAAVVASAALVAGVLTGADAAFAGVTGSTGNAWAVSPYAQFGASAYPAAVNATTPFWYYRFEETSGTTAADSAGSRPGEYSGAPTLNQPGALLRQTSRAVRFDGVNDCVYSGASVPALAQPANYSVLLWFRTTSTAGAKLAGLEKSRTGSSTQYDRHIYMTPTGQLAFGVWTGAPTVVTSPGSYNDGGWHQVVATMKSSGAGAGMSLYVDGVLVASDPNTTSEAYSGWWRVGCGNLGAWPGGVPQSDTYFDGTIDEAAMYTSTLTATQVRTLFYAN